VIVPEIEVEKVLEEERSLADRLKQGVVNERLDLNKINKEDLERFRDANGFLDFARVEKAVNELLRRDAVKTESTTSPYDNDLIRAAEKITQTTVEKADLDVKSDETRDRVTTQQVDEKPPAKSTYFDIPVKTADQRFQEVLNSDRTLKEYLVKAVDTRGKLRFERLDQRVLEKLRDRATGLLDVDKLKKTAEELARKERLRTIAGTISGKPTVNRETGRVDRISDTLARDTKAREELLNAVDADGNLDFTKIPQEDLDKFRDEATGQLDLDRLKQTANDLIELESSNDDKQFFDINAKKKAALKIEETLA